MNIMRNWKLAFSFLPLGSSFPSTSWPGLSPFSVISVKYLKSIFCDKLFFQPNFRTQSLPRRLPILPLKHLWLSSHPKQSHLSFQLLPILWNLHPVQFKQGIVIADQITFPPRYSESRSDIEIKVVYILCRNVCGAPADFLF